MNLIPLIDHLQESKVGTKEKTLFVNMIPATAAKGVLLRNPLTGTPIDYEVPGFYRAGFKLITRAGGYEAGEALAGRAIAALTLPHGAKLGNMVFRHCRPKTEIAVFPLSKGNLLEFSVDFDAVFHIEAPPEPPPVPEPEPEVPDGP